MKSQPRVWDKARIVPISYHPQRVGTPARNAWLPENSISRQDFDGLKVHNFGNMPGGPAQTAPKELKHHARTYAEGRVAGTVNRRSATAALLRAVCRNWAK
jgi:hypothetical protein